jgi:hypothetical protein
MAVIQIPPFATLNGYASPEEAAIAGYPPTARARAVSVRSLGRIPVLEPGVRAVTEGKFSGAGEWVEVIIDTDPTHPGKVKCFEENGLWYEWGGSF